MKRALLITLFCLQLPVLFAQETISSIELVQLNILYRNYDNAIKVAVSNSEDSEIRLRGENCTIRKDSTNGYYFIQPGNGRIANLIVETLRGDSVIYSNKTKFRVAPLPDPTIYFGSSKSGGKAAINSRLLQAIYPPGVPLKCIFKVTHWELFHDGESKAKGTGAIISEASEFLDSLKEPTSLFFKVTVQGGDGVSRNLDAHYTVDPNVKQEVPIISTGCG